jgi:hypothetical protein
MLRDCRADLPQGWRYFVSTYVPVVRKILTHYAGPEPSEARLEQILRDLRRPDSPLFQSDEPSPERTFVAGLRQNILAGLPSAEPALDLATVAEALEPLTMTEKHAAWFETLRYDAATTGELMRIAPATVQKIRDRAAELLRGKLDHWSRSILADNGLALGREAEAAAGNDCLPPKAFLDILDGRTTWREREVMEGHVNTCWHCVDENARMEEVIGLLRWAKPLDEPEAARYWELLSIPPERKPAWKRLFGAG